MKKKRDGARERGREGEGEILKESNEPVKNVCNRSCASLDAGVLITSAQFIRQLFSMCCCCSCNVACCLGHTTTKATRTKRNGTKWFTVLARSVAKERTTGSAQLELVTRVFAFLYHFFYPLGAVRCLINNNGGKRDRAHALFRRPRLTST